MRLLNRELGSWLGLMIMSAIVLAVACSSKSGRDADWEEVQKAATRVESGLRHETLIALRSKVADLDAAVANYTRHNVEGQKEQRVRSINQAVDALEWGIDHDLESGIDRKKIDLIWDGTDHFEFYSARQYLNAEVGCEATEGKLYIMKRDLSLACLAYAQNALLGPEKPWSIRQQDLNALRTKCASDYDNYKKVITNPPAATQSRTLLLGATEYSAGARVVPNRRIRVVVDADFPVSFGLLDPTMIGSEDLESQKLYYPTLDCGAAEVMHSQKECGTPKGDRVLVVQDMRRSKGPGNRVTVSLSTCASSDCN